MAGPSIIFFLKKIFSHTHLAVTETNRNCTCSLFYEIIRDVCDPNDRVTWSVSCGTMGKTCVESWCVQGSAEGIAGEPGATLITAF